MLLLGALAGGVGRSLTNAAVRKKAKTNKEYRNSKFREARDKFRRQQ